MIRSSLAAGLHRASCPPRALSATFEFRLQLHQHRVSESPTGRALPTKPIPVMKSSWRKATQGHPMPRSRHSHDDTSQQGRREWECKHPSRKSLTFWIRVGCILKGLVVYGGLLIVVMVLNVCCWKIAERYLAWSKQRRTCE